VFNHVASTAQNLQVIDRHIIDIVVIQMVDIEIVSAPTIFARLLLSASVQRPETQIFPVIGQQIDFSVPVSTGKSTLKDHCVTFCFSFGGIHVVNGLVIWHSISINSIPPLPNLSRWVKTNLLS